MLSMHNSDSEKIENEYIQQINKSLKMFEKLLNLASLENYYPSIIIKGRMICYETTELLLFKKEGIEYYPEKTTFHQNIEKLYEYHILPKECYNFLHLIRRHGNEAIHKMEQCNELIFSFLKAFHFYMQWFDNYYSDKYQTNFQIEKCCELISSLIYDEKKDELDFDKVISEFNSKFFNKLKLEEHMTNLYITSIKNEINRLTKEKIEKENNLMNIHSEMIENDTSSKEEDSATKEIERLTEELRIKEKTHKKQIDELGKQNRKILKQLDEYRKLFEKGLSILYESNERGKRIESKIDDLHSKIDNISNQITAMQSLTERQIKNAQSPDEIERIIGDYMDACIDNIMKYSMNFTENQNYHIEKKKLTYSIGEEGWNKLCEKSKTFLITSKVMYNHLITMDDIIDYSGICVLVTKALEVEMHKRFFTNFLEYLDEKYDRKYEKYPTSLLYRYREPLLSEKFTMGKIAYVLCHKEKKREKSHQKIQNKLRLMEYCKENVFSNYSEEKIEELLARYASSIEDIREKYRNPSAHTNEIKRIDAEECFNLVLDIEKLLKQMLDSFDA